MATSKTVGETLAGLISRLEKTSDTPGLDAQVLLARLLDRPRSWVLAHPEAPLTGDLPAALEALVARLEGGEPLPYILGRWEFFGLEFEVTPDVLIPRPETEPLVERALSWLRKPGVESRELRVLDVGTGSGCIAISLAVNVPGVVVTATDISAAALSVARRNAERLRVANRVTFLEADLIPGNDRGPQTVDRDSPSIVHRPPSYDLIVSNLPYIPTPILHQLPIYHREPTLALDGGADGLDLIRRLLAKAPTALAPGGMLLLEIEASEGPAAQMLTFETFPKARVQIHTDLAGRDRLMEVQT